MFNKVYFEKEILSYPLGKMLQEKFANLEWEEIENHNCIPQMQQRRNAEFEELKRYLIIGTRKTHKYAENCKISDYLVPYTSSGCSAMCLYCYLVAAYNKCAYLRLFVNREEMFEKLKKKAEKAEKPLTFEIGSNSDLVLENTITGNLVWTIENFAKTTQGNITFPTKFCMTDSLLPLDHKGKTIFRMSVNPPSIIHDIELGTSPLAKRIQSVNDMAEAGYPVGILVAPIILQDDYEQIYGELFTTLADTLTQKAKSHLTIEMIFMTYSYVTHMINKDAFPNQCDFFDRGQMSGMGKYYYREEIKERARPFFLQEVQAKLPSARIVYIC